MDTTQQGDAEIGKKTTAAIAAEGQPPVVNNKPPAQAPPPPTIQQSSRPKVNPRDADQMSRRTCRMFFPSSGRMGFDMITVSDELPPIETVRDMIAYETRLRLSQPIQELMDLYHTNEDSVT
jgi:hypothetical protein